MSIDDTIKLGDTVTPENISQLGVGSTVRFGRGTDIVCTKTGPDEWHSDGGFDYNDADMTNDEDGLPCTVRTVVPA